MAAAGTFKSGWDELNRTFPVDLVSVLSRDRLQLRRAEEAAEDGVD
jgi:hypothetical protein